MDKLNIMNWQWFVYWFPVNRQFKDDKRALGDFECIQVYNAVNKTVNYKKFKMHIELIAVKLHVNLYSMVVTNRDGLVKVV